MNNYDLNNEIDDNIFNTTDDNIQRNIEYMGITIILLLSFSQIVCYSFQNCYIKIENTYKLSKKTKKIKNIDLENLINECSICLEKYKLNEKIIQLDCDHIFHKSCFDLWFQKNNSCPICRDNIII